MKPIEIQVRTKLQHLWAEVSEELADLIDPGLKYGRGPENIQNKLLESSILVALFEDAEAGYAPMSRQRIEVSRIPRNRAILKKLKHNIVEYLNFSLLSDVLEKDQ
jgi:ppGpp synthetase/RelA/SpoT-type nucleotidyltranferase